MNTLKKKRKKSLEKVIRKEKRKKKKKIEDERKRKKPTKTVRLDDGTPVYATVSFSFEVNEFLTNRVEQGYLSDDSVSFDDSINLSKELDGYPFIEIKESTIDLIEYRTPEKQEKDSALAIVKPIKQRTDDG